MTEATDQDEELRRSVMEKLRCQLADLDTLERVQAHLQAGGSAKDHWVRDFLARVEEDEA